MTRLPKRRCDETVLYPAILDLFCDQHFAFVEVPYFGKRVDLVFAGHGIDKLHAIEIKLKDWQGALKQAAVNQLFAHFSYVALPEARVRTLRPEQKDAFGRYHVGLISVGITATVVIPAVQNGYFHQGHYDLVQALLVKISSKRKAKRLGVITRAIANRKRALEFLQVGAHTGKRTL
ncbi:MAG: hypothetical protein WB729_06775 [Candidatus Sulfotelmatobacter sp.]